MSFFRILNGTEYPKAKVKDTDFEQFYPAINTNMAWKSLEPFAYQAEQCYIVPFISEAYYQELSLEYSKLPIAEVQQLCTPTNSANFIQTIPVADLVFYYLRCASAYYTIYDALPHMNLSIGDAGVTEKTPDQTMPVRQWTYKNTRWDAYMKAYKMLDRAIQLMESEIEKDANAFIKYSSSEAYSVSKQLLLPNATVLSEYINIRGSRRAYIGLRPYIAKSERLYLRPLLGTDFYTELKSQHTAGTLTAENTAILPYVRAFLAECATIESVPEVNLYNAGDGWRILETMDGITASKAVQDRSLQHLITKAEENRDYHRAELEGFLYTNLDDYATFKADEVANKESTTNQEEDQAFEDEELEGGAFI